MQSSGNGSGISDKQCGGNRWAIRPRRRRAVGPGAGGMCILLFIATLPAFPWGREGHDLVARVAEAQLHDAARARVAAILGPGQTMVSVSSWADELRSQRPKTGPWHYVDIPIDQPRLVMTRDCPDGNCVVAQIAVVRRILRDPAASADERREALMFLIHFIGDVHQPLHCSDNHDHGGNGVPVQFLDYRGNLHSLWDSVLLGRMGSEDQLFPALERESARRAKKFDQGDVTRWANDAHKQARKLVYGKLPKPQAGEAAIIDAAYEKAADALIRRQIEAAGARLAWVLNTDLGD